MRLLVRALAVLATVLLGWTSVAFSELAAAAPVHAEIAYAYDSHGNPAAAEHSTIERGPPTRDHNRGTTHDAVDHWSHGASARPNGPTTAATYIYDYLAPLAQTTRGRRAATERVGGPGIARIVVQQSSVAANTVDEVATVVPKAVHGHSASSTATNYLYRLYDAETGAYLKTGISKNPGSRYTKTFMQDKEMEILQKGTRREMLNLERCIVDRDPGPLNREPWAGSMSWDVP